MMLARSAGLGRLLAPRLMMAAGAHGSALHSVASVAAQQPPQAQQPDFGGEVARLYGDFFVQLRPSWERHVEAVAQHVAPAPMTILDIASGPGQPAMLLAQRFPTATVLSTDLAPDMVAQAASSVAAAGLAGQVSCSTMDMQDMAAVGSGTCDVVTASYGLMFAPELPRALSEVHRVLRPGGYLVTTVWRTMPMMSLVGEVMAAVLGHAPPPPPINPMSLSEDIALDGPLAAAGLQLVAEESGSISFDLGTDPDRQWRLGTITVLPKLQELAEAGTHGDNVMEKARDAFIAATAGWKDPATGSVILPPATYRLVVCRKA